MAGTFSWWLPAVFFTLIIFFAFLVYFCRKKRLSVAKDFQKLILIVIIFRFCYAGFLTFLQYDFWLQNDFSRFLLPPYQSIEYFLSYSFSHFWLKVLLSVISASVFFIFLYLLKKYRSGLFEEGEIELGFLLSLVSGWPYFLVFVPLVFVFLLVFSIFGRIFWQVKRVKIGPAFLFSSLIISFWGQDLLNMLKLNRF